ncbi:ABC transporter permease [Pseudonocardia yunnanensis]|uniref:ABC transporter permease n=1 Tax=Pseudonocardia yunnanensis TaxID=58107 RepID=A0ABW4F5E5_9PSEU
MLRYLLKKTLGWLLMIVVATNLTYFLANLFLDPRVNYLQLRPPRTPEEIDRSLAQYNLSPATPLLDRWWHWITDIVLHWNWGYSPVGDSVNTQIAFRIGVSAQLVLLSTILSTIIGIALGVYTGSRQYRFADRFHQGLSIITINVPTVVASLVVVLLAIMLNQSLGSTLLFVAGAQSPTVSGFWPLVLDRIQHLVLPTISLTLTSYAGYHLLQRSLLLDNINSDYVRTARAKGLTRQEAIRRHGLRTSLIPVATSVAFAVPALFTGAVITETIFGWQGMGQYFTSTISKNDVNGVVAVAAFGALMTAIGAILADIAVVVLDPRVRVTGS